MNNNELKIKINQLLTKGEDREQLPTIGNLGPITSQIMINANKLPGDILAKAGYGELADAKFNGPAPDDAEVARAILALLE